MKKIFSWALIILILAGCSKSNNPMGITPTNSATPLPTATPIPSPTATPIPEPLNVNNAKNLSVTGFWGNGTLLDSYYSPDNSLFIVSFSHAIWVLDAKSLETKCTLTVSDQIGYSAITSDNRTLVAGVTEAVYKTRPIPGAMLTWDVNSCSPLQKQTDFEHYPYHFKNVGADKVYSFAYSLLANENRLLIYMQQRDPLTLQVVSENDYSDFLIDYSSASNRVAMIGDGIIAVYNLDQGLTKSIFSGRVSNVDYAANGAISPDGKLVALRGASSDTPNLVASWKGVLRIWNVDTGMKIFGDDRFSSSSIIKFISNSKLAIADNLNIKIMDIPSLTTVATLGYTSIGTRNPYSGPIDKVLVQRAPGEDQFMVITDDGYRVSIQVYDLNTYQLIRTVWIPSIYEDSSQGPNEKDLNNISKITGPLQPYDLNNVPITVGYHIPEEISNLPDNQKSLKVSADNQYLAILYGTTAWNYNRFALLKYGVNEPILQDFAEDQSTVTYTKSSFSQNGKYLVVVKEIETGGDAQKHIIGSFTSTVMSWDLSTMTALPEFNVDGAIAGIATLNSGLLAVTFGLFDTGLSIWNLPNGEQLYSGLYALNDGKIILSSDESKLVIFSDWSNTQFSYLGQQQSRFFYILEAK